MALIALTLACLATRAAGYRVFMSLNEAPSVLATAPDSWAASRRVADGIVGPGHPNPKTPLTIAERGGVSSLFHGKPHVLSTSMPVFRGEPNRDVNWTNLIPWYAADTGFTGVTDVFLRGDASPDVNLTLTVKQLNRVQRVGFMPVVVVARNEPMTDDIKAAFRHPHCEGVVVGAGFMHPTLLAEGVNIARYVSDLGKKVYVVRAPSRPSGGSHLQQLRTFVEGLRRDLGDVVCTDQVTIVLNAFPVNQTKIAFLPDTINGAPAETYTGGVLMTGQYGDTVCPPGLPPKYPPSPASPVRPSPSPVRPSPVRPSPSPIPSPVRPSPSPVRPSPSPSPSPVRPSPSPVRPSPSPVRPNPSPASSLKAAASRSSRLAGAAVTVRGLSIARYVAVASAQYNQLGAENELKWQATEPSPGMFTYGDGDKIQQFAASIGARMHGHCLVWYLFLPTWVTLLIGSALRDAMVNHITNVVGHYAGKIGSWDVVNEAVADVGWPADSYGLRTNSIWVQQLGLSYIDVAFRAARSADSKALLFYNDYLIEQNNQKTDMVFALVAGMRSRGVPIDGVGFQSHMWGGANYTLFAQAMKRFTDLGLIVRLSEMTDDVTPFQGTQAQKFAQQAVVYGEITRVCSQNPLCQGVMTWEFSDAFSGASYPLPFDAEYNPKPAYYAMLNAFDGAFPSYVAPATFHKI